MQLNFALLTLAFSYRKAALSLEMSTENFESFLFSNTAVDE